MATNNAVNNNFPGGITTNGSLNINATGSSTTSIGSSGSGAITINAKALSFNINNNNLTLNSGSSALSISSSVTSGALNIGSSSTTSLSITSSTSSMSTGTSSTNMTYTLPGATALTIGNNGNPSIESSGNILIGSSSAGAGWNIGTSGARTITIGNTSSNSDVNFDCGTGTMNIGTSTPVFTLGNSSGATSINISTGTGGIIFGSNNPGAGVTLNSGIYFRNAGASNLTYTLPTTASIGKIFRMTGNTPSTGKWIIAQNAGQTIHSTATSTTTGTGGSITAGGRYDAIEIVCITADTDFSIVNSKGTLVFV